MRGGEPWVAPLSLFTSLAAGFPCAAAARKLGRGGGPRRPRGLVSIWVLWTSPLFCIPGSLRRWEGGLL